jgi:hypothetical protein
MKEKYYFYVHRRKVNNNGKTRKTDRQHLFRISLRARFFSTVGLPRPFPVSTLCFFLFPQVPFQTLNWGERRALLIFFRGVGIMKTSSTHVFAKRLFPFDVSLAYTRNYASPICTSNPF